MSPTPLQIPGARLEPVDWAAVDGWASDDHAEAYATFLASCRAIVNRGAARGETRPIYPGLKTVCRRALRAVPRDADGARRFFEENFHPYRIARVEETEGFLTGYYEPIVAGSRVRTDEYTVPMYRRPTDLVALGQRRKGGFPNKGKVGRRVGKGKKSKLVDYHDRAAILDGALAGRGLEICWLKDPIDAFFIHIQGSARVQLEDGGVLRLNYEAHNGHPYTPVGRILIDRGIVPKEEMSLARIRDWMAENPQEGEELRRKNKSFVFFRVTELQDHEEAVGAQGVPLTTLRSIAVDRALHVYGTPFFIDAELPIASVDAATPFRRLMIAQDTGSAIVGPARADLYFGAGDEAGRVAGRIRHPARFTMLVPREVDPALRRAPLPRPRPAAAVVASETDAKAGEAPLPRPRPRT